MILLLLALIFLLGVYWYLTKNYNYWHVRNVVYEKPQFLVGNLLPLLMRKLSLGEYLRNVYSAHPKEPYVGLFLANSPCLLVRDYELTMDIINKNIDSFAHRMVQFDEKREPILSKTIFALEKQTWKSARNGITPCFTSSKLKQYFEQMTPIANEVNQRLENNKEQDLLALTWCFTVDNINRSLFGLQSKAILDENDDLLRLSKMLYGTDLMTTISKFFIFASPNIYSAFKLTAFPRSAVEKVKKLTAEMIDFIETSDNKLANVMTHLHKLWKKDEVEPIQQSYKYDMNGLASMFFALLVAGTDTLSANMTYAMYELAKHQDIQEKLRQEVLQYCSEGISSLNYENVTSMKYLQMVIMETARLHPSFPFLDRVCTKDYVIPGTNCKLNKGTFVFIPMWGFHMDEKYWNNPTEFQPERFADMNEINKKPYFPFGNGSRICVGMRFAMMEMQFLLASLIICGWRWKLPTVAEPVRCNPLTYTNLPDKPLKVIFERITTSGT